MSLWQGDLGIDEGVAQSIYRLDTSKMKEIGLEELKPGQSWESDLGYVIRFIGVERFASFQVAYEPGRFVALLGATLAMLGMFFGLGVQRRRIWVMMHKVGSGSSVIEVAGLAKSTNHEISKDLNKVLSALGITERNKTGSRSI